MWRAWFASIASIFTIIFIFGNTYTQAINITVDFNEDSVGNSSLCESLTGSCNVRSAWALCEETMDDPCAIILLENSTHTIDAALGQLELQTGMQVSLIGNGAHIIGQANLDRRRTLSQLEYTERVEAAQISVESDFPLVTGVLRDTKSALQNYTVGCVIGCSLDVITFSACHAGQDIWQDTYFRLYDSNGAQVDEDDDTCGRASQITYYIPYDASCQEYCLHVGCWAGRSCSANVTYEFTTIAPTEAPTVAVGSFPLITGVLRDTNNALQNYAEACVTGCPQHVLFFSTCHDGHDTRQSTYFRLFVNSTVQVAENEHYCGWSSEITYIVPDNSPCQEYCLHVGCWEFSDCSANVTFEEVSNSTDYLVHTGAMSDTNNALQNTAVGCVMGCPLDVLIFSACHDRQDTDQNTYFRLYDSKAAQVFENDDACNGSSQITYYVPDDAPCQEYCLHVGCYGDSSCSAKVTFYKTSLKDDVDWSNQTRFIHYRHSDDSYLWNGTALSLHSTSFSGFGAESGGTVYLQGDSSLLIDGCQFHDVTAVVGGAVYVTQNNHPVRITQSSFSGAMAAFGGAVYIGSGVSNFTLDSSVFLECDALVSGGALMLQRENHNARIINCKFYNCSAGLGGGGTFIGSNNNNITASSSNFEGCVADENGGGMYLDHDNNHFTLVGTVFRNCGAGSSSTNDIPPGGGGLFLGECNFHVTVTYSFFDSCYGTVGGGLLAYQSNAQLRVDKTNFTNCYAVDGGGIRLFSNNSDSYIGESIFLWCSAGYDGGGVFIGYSNDNLRLMNSDFNHCVAGESGGGISLYESNWGVTISGVTIRNSAAYWGGGLFLGLRNFNHTILSVELKNCSAKYGGGGIQANLYNNDLQIKNVTLDSCFVSLVGNGGGMYLGKTNYNVNLATVVITNCTSDRGLGGGLFVSSRNNYLTLHEVQISHCSAKSGGGIYFHGSTTKITVLSSSVFNNRAAVNGGGIVASAQTQELVLVDTIIAGNTALRDGGGIYLDGGNAGFAMLDWRSYNNRKTIELQPLPTKNYFLSIRAPEAIGYYVYFDERSEIPASHDFLVGSHIKDVYQFGDSQPGINAPPLWYQGSMDVHYIMDGDNSNENGDSSDEYFGIRMFVVPIFADVQGPVVLFNNTARNRGGGLYVYSGATCSVLFGSQFIDNTAVDGGGIYLRNAIVGLVAHKLNFEHNTASSGDGGGVLISSSCIGLQFKDCNFLHNAATTAGGALSFLTNNGADGSLGNSDVNTIVGCTFQDNRANAFGGAIYLGVRNSVHIDNCKIADSFSAGSGGGIFLSEDSNLYVTSTNMTNNVAAARGGAVALGLRCHGDIFNSSILRSNASYGGGVSVLDFSTIKLSRVQVSGGHARQGGAMACSRSWAPQVSNSWFSNNTAFRGSALYMYGVRGGNILGDTVAYFDNRATVGTIYWVNDTATGSGAYARNFDFDHSNVVQYGSGLATQAVLLRVPAEATINAYGESFIPIVALTATLYDAYGQLSPANKPAYVQVSILGASAEQCGGRFPFLSGANVGLAGVFLKNGEAMFSDLSGSCNPGGNITLLFTAHLTDQLDLSAQQQTLSARMKLHFRTCVAGEYNIGGKCLRCPLGTYSLTDSVTECMECRTLRSVRECYGKDLFLEAGYWRRYPHSDTIYACPGELNGCAGNNRTGDASCALGYEGPKCSVCSDGYFMSDTTCKPCEDAGQLSDATGLFVAVGGAILVATVLMLVYRHKRRNSPKSRSVVQSLFDRMAWLTDEMKEASVQLKIVITTYQICSVIPVSMDVTFPGPFARFLDGMSIFSLDVLSIVPLSCVSGRRYTFIDKLLMTTLAPIGLGILILICCLLDYGRYTARTDGSRVVERSKSAINKMVTRYLTVFLFLTYLVLPNLATSIFRTFLCTEITKDDGTDNYDLYLIADMRISCRSDYYRRGVIYAACMAVVYVVGIPLMYFILLYRSRADIKGRYEVICVPTTVNTGKNDDMDDNDNAADGASGNASSDKGPVVKEGKPINQLALRRDPAAYRARMISFLWDSYEPQFWYWELVETTRRLMLTAVLSVCASGTSAQAILALLLSLAYIKLYGLFQPYERDADDWYAETGQYQIFLTFLGAHICQRQLLGSHMNVYISAALIIINTSVAMIFLGGFIGRIYSHARKRVRSHKPVKREDEGEDGADSGDDQLEDQENFARMSTQSRASRDDTGRGGRMSLHSAHSSVVDIGLVEYTQKQQVSV